MNEQKIIIVPDNPDLITIPIWVDASAEGFAALARCLRDGTFTVYQETSKSVRLEVTR
jgi:hypothetical protein